MSRRRAGVWIGIALVLACFCAGCQSEIPVPAYAYNIGRSSQPTKPASLQAETSPSTPVPDASPPGSNDLPRAAVLGNLDVPTPPAGETPSGQGTSGQTTTAQGTSGLAPTGQGTSGLAASTGPDKAAPLVRNNDIRLTQRACPAVAKPPYPEEAKKAKAEGLVTAKCVVETDGSLTCEATWSTAPALTKPVLDQLAKEKVPPFTLKDGTAVRVECSYSYRYKP